MARVAPRSSIIYQNEERTITLLDIPTSIAKSQGRSDVLLSTLPLEAPIELKDDYTPKSQKEKVQTRKAQQFPYAPQHLEYKAVIEQALGEIQAHVSGPWCLPRQFLNPRPHYGEDVEMKDPEKELESRLREWAAWKESKGDNPALDLQKLMATLGVTSEDAATPAGVVSQQWTMSYRPAREATTGAHVAETVTRKQATEPFRSTFHNPEDCSLELSIAENSAQPAQPGQELRFTIPPRSTLFLSDTAQPDAFRASFRQVTDEYTLPRHFDLVLLDPPWPNRSAKRKGAYEQVGGMPYLKRMLLNMDMDTYLEHNALVGVWITNKESLREHVLGAGGLFERWNVGLIEEWIWIKTTTKGEPMFDMDSSMRKPYEILLLGRAAPNAWTTMSHATSVATRVIAAVPDIHSRKPCLKELLEPYMPSPSDYGALEVFSRYLVSGWMSWGNEVLKYNCDQYWASPRGHEAASQHHLPFRTAA